MYSEENIIWEEEFRVDVMCDVELKERDEDLYCCCLVL